MHHVLKVRVLDASGQASKSVVYWSAGNGLANFFFLTKNTRRFSTSSTSDAKSHPSVIVDTTRERVSIDQSTSEVRVPLVVHAMDSAGNVGEVVVGSNGIRAPKPAATIILRKPTHVQLPITLPKLSLQHHAGELSVALQRTSESAKVILFNTVVRISDAKDDTTRVLNFKLTPGRYRVLLGYPDSRWIGLDTLPEFTVQPGDTALALPLVLAKPGWAIEMVGNPAPSLSATDLSGRKIDLQAFGGQIVILDFWGYWCGPCIASFPYLNAVLAEYRAKGATVTVVAIHDAGVRTVQEYENAIRLSSQDISEKTKQFVVLLDDPLPEAKAIPFEDRDHQGLTQRNYRVENYPSTYVIGANGRLIGVAAGPEELSKLVELAVQMKDAASKDKM